MSEDSENETIQASCEICGEMIQANNLSLLRSKYELHLIDHKKEEERARNRVKLVKSGSGWILTKGEPPSFP
jgi:hypothetical protein